MKGGDREGQAKKGDRERQAKGDRERANNRGDGGGEEEGEAMKVIESRKQGGAVRGRGRGKGRGKGGGVEKEWRREVKK